MPNKELYEAIYKRKSFHLFRNVGEEKLSAEELADIVSAFESFEPLYPDIRTRLRVVPAEETNYKGGAEYCLYIYSEKKDNYLQNAGYLGEQLDLYLVSKGIGSLWYGLGKTEEKTLDGLDYVIMMPIRRVDSADKFRRDMFKAKRKAVSDIWSGEAIPGVTDIARFSPSACNSQPWYAERKDNTLKVWRYRKAGRVGILTQSAALYFNRIDIGIYLCILELCFAHEGISTERKLFDDPGSELEMTLVAEYTIKE